MTDVDGIDGKRHPLPRGGETVALPGLGAVDARMIAAMRIVLATSALAIIYIDPTEPARLVTLTYSSLALYCVYSIALLVSVMRGRSLVDECYQHWFDIAFYACLIAMTEGTSSIFFHFFFFAILVASFTYGFRQGLLAASVSTGLFVTVGLATSPVGADFELSRSLIRPVYLLTIGYMVAYWGGYEIALKRRLHFLKEVAEGANPRFGSEHLLDISVQRVRDFFRAQCCLLFIDPSDGKPALLYRADDLATNRSNPQEIDSGAARVFQSFPEDAAAVYQRAPKAAVWCRGARALAWNAATGAGATVAESALRGTANLIEVSSYATTPFRMGGRTVGRMFVGFTNGRVNRAECEFLGQVVVQIAGLVEYVSLLEELAHSAAELERARISRDLHDSTMQPYLGLRFALEALARKMDPGSALAAQADELIQMTSRAMADLRLYIAGLRSGNETEEHAPLIIALRNQIARYTTYYGIEVKMQGTAIGQIGQRVAAEVFQVVSEALSNIRRHTSARQAFIDMRREAEQLIVRIGNELAADTEHAVAPFVPASIAERTKALGGSIKVKANHAGHTVVVVTIPL